MPITRANFRRKPRAPWRDWPKRGIPLVSQSVLLKGVNDDVETLAALMRGFVENRIKPYYLHHPDLAPGTSHFRTGIEEGLGLMRELRARLSGLAMPTYMLDIPGGFGKVPLESAQCRKDRAAAIASATLAGCGMTILMLRQAQHED